MYVWVILPGFHLMLTQSFLVHLEVLSTGLKENVFWLTFTSSVCSKYVCYVSISINLFDITQICGQPFWSPQLHLSLAEDQPQKCGLRGHEDAV